MAAAVDADAKAAEQKIPRRVIRSDDLQKYSDIVIIEDRQEILALSQPGALYTELLNHIKDKTRSQNVTVSFVFRNAGNTWFAWVPRFSVGREDIPGPVAAQEGLTRMKREGRLPSFGFFLRFAGEIIPQVEETIQRELGIADGWNAEIITKISIGTHFDLH
jgi:hypothetical protein